jgi:hypothetical protein
MKGNNKASVFNGTVKFMWALCLVLLVCLYFWYTLEHPHDSLFHMPSGSAATTASKTKATAARGEPLSGAAAAAAAVHIETHNAIIEKTHRDYATILPEIIPNPPAARDLAFRTLYDVVTKWSPDNPEVPPDFRETLQHFNYGDPFERSVAEKYRNAELPFKVYNISEFVDVSRLWTDAYLSHELGRTGKRHHVEKSKDNHFMFWTPKGSSRMKTFVPPTELVSMTYDEWLVLAYKAEEERLGNASAHYYFMTNADRGDRGRSFVAADLPMFSSGLKNFFIFKPEANKGIQCRFGMRGVIAESHYDGGRNMVAMLKGQKVGVLLLCCCCVAAVLLLCCCCVAVVLLL